MNKPKYVNRLFLAMFFVYIGVMLLINIFRINLNTTGSLLIGELIYLVPCLLYILFMRIPLKMEIPLRPIHVTTLLKIVLFTVLIYPLISLLNLISMFFVTNHLQDTVSQLNGAHFFRNLLLMAVIPAVVEEFMFRGVFYGAYRKRCRLFGALASGFVFGMAHMNLNQFCYAFVLGFVMCLLIEATGSILASVFLHFLVNGWSVVVLWGSERVAGLNGLNSSEQISAAADALAGNDMLVLVIPLSIVALISTALAACVLVWIGKGCGRVEFLKETFRLPKFKRSGEDALHTGEVRVLENKIITPVFVLNAILFFGFMIWFG